MTIPQAFELALQHHQAGRLAEAEALYRQILAVQPNHADALHLLGVIAHRCGHNDLAEDLIRRAIVANPAGLHYYVNLGNTLFVQKRLDEAIAWYRRALQIKPDFAEVHSNLGNALRDRGQLDEAIAACRRALQINPDFPEAHNNLGNALRGKGHLDEAIAAYRCALNVRPDYPEVHNNLGNTLRERGQLDEGMAACRRALELKPDYPEAHNNLGLALAELGERDEAIASYRRALELKPDYAEAHNNLGNALRDRGPLDDAVAAYRRALQHNPEYVEAHNNLGGALKDQRNLDEAIAAFRRALQLRPNSPEILNNLGNALKDQGDLEEAISTYRHALRIKPDCGWAHSNLIYTQLFQPNCTDIEIVEEHERWNRQFSDPLTRFVQPHANDRSLERRLRIGYVSPDFRDHVIGRNLIPLFKCHDRKSFDLFCYSGVIQTDTVTAEFQQCADHWRYTVGVCDDTFAEMIRRDEIDILVDLTQHMAGNRLPMFARKPAPLQVSFAGYPDSTGLEAIEYRISDRLLEARSSNEGTQGRKQLYLIDSFWCYDPHGANVQVSASPASKSGSITFGSLNNFCKINERMLRVWAGILGKVNDSRLVLRSPFGTHRKRTLELLEREGVKGGRVEFIDALPRRAYLELYHLLDIALDTFPYNGHTTNLDALWMGVPVVSLMGEKPVSRAGLSQLTNIGLSALVAYSEEDYVTIAVTLATDLPRLMQLRSTLRDRMQKSALMDAASFARQVEQAYRTMWRAWCHNNTLVKTI